MNNPLVYTSGGWGAQEHSSTIWRTYCDLPEEMHSEPQKHTILGLFLFL